MTTSGKYFVCSFFQVFLKQTKHLKDILGVSFTGKTAISWVIYFVKKWRIVRALRYAKQFITQLVIRGIYFRHLFSISKKPVINNSISNKTKSNKPMTKETSNNNNLGTKVTFLQKEHSIFRENFQNKENTIQKVLEHIAALLKPINSPTLTDNNSKQFFIIKQIATRWE